MGIRLSSVILIAASVGLLSNCSGIRLRQPLRSTEYDWRLFGGSETRTNAAPQFLEPPLKLVWSYDASAGFGPSALSAKDSVLFIATLQGELQVISIKDGERLGWVSLGSAIASAPVVDGTTVIVATADEKNNVISYDFSSARKYWKRTAGPVESAPLSVGRLIIIATMNGTLLALDRDTGEERWSIQVSQPIRSSPASDGERVFFGCDDGAVRGVNAITGNLLWTARTGAAVFANPIVIDSLVIVGSLDSTVYAFHVQSGEIAWKYRTSGMVYAPAAGFEHRVVVGTAHGDLLCLDTRTGRLLWSALGGDAGGVINAAPLIVGNIVYVGTLDKQLYALELSDGALRWQTELPGRMKTSPAVFGKRLFIPVENRIVLCYRSTSGEE